MPTSAELIAAVAAAMELEQSSVGTLFRNLREDGQIGEGGRGRNALYLTLSDATRVLVATLVSGEARHAAGAVAAIYGWRGRILVESPKADPRPAYPDILRPTFFERLAHRDAPRPIAFGSMVDALMAALAAGRLTPAVPEEEVLSRAGRGRRQPSRDEPFARLELRTRRREGRFETEGATLSFGRRHVYGVLLEFSPRRGARAEGEAQDHTIRRIGLPVLLRLVEEARDWE